MAGAASAQNISARVDGVVVNFPDVQPSMVNGRVMVPMRGVFEHMGANVTWHHETRTVVAQSAKTEIRLPIGSMHAWVDGRQMSLDSPAIIRNGRTLVPLRFTAEALDASVDWMADTRTVMITTAGNVAARPNPTNPTRPVGRTTTLPVDTVIPFRLDSKLSSNGNQVGDRFTATLAPLSDQAEYSGLPQGTRIEGRIHTAKAREGNTPGVLGFDFERITLPGGRSYPIDGALIGLDSNSVMDENGRLVARSEAKKNDLKYVGYGAGAGVLLSVLGKGNLITNALIGGALGYLYEEIQKGQQKPKDVSLDQGTKFGVRLTRELTVRLPASNPAK